MKLRQFILATIIPAAILGTSMSAAAKGFEPMQQQQMQQVQQHHQKPGKFEQRHDRHEHKRFIRVQRGDTLSRLARRYHTTVYRLKRLNHLRGDTIYIGQRIRVR